LLPYELQQLHFHPYDQPEELMLDLELHHEPVDPQLLLLMDQHPEL
jgi:hypothetical protein